jgi:hypothetical protein
VGNDTRVDMPNCNIAAIWTPIFEWYVVRLRPKNGHQKSMWLEEIELPPQKYDNHCRLNRNIIREGLHFDNE